MNRTVKLVSTAALTASLALALFAQEPPVLRVGYLPATHDALLFIALEQRLFDSRKVRVEARGYENSVQILSDLRAGHLDVGIPGIASPAAEIGGQARMTIIGGAAARSAALVAPKGSTVAKASSPQEKVKQLRGRRIGAVRGSTGLAVLRQGLAQAGLDNRQVELKEFNKPAEIISFLLSGNLDYGLLWSPHMTIAESKGLEIVLWMSDILKDHVCCRQVARDDYLPNKAALGAYLAGLIKAKRMLDDAQRDPALQKKVLASLGTYLTTLTESQLRMELFGNAPRTTVSPDLNSEGIDQYLDAMLAANLMNQQQCDSVRRKINGEFLELAFVELGCTRAGARECAREGLTQCTCAK